MSTDPTEMLRDAASKRAAAAALSREALDLEQQAEILSAPKVVFESKGAALTLTQAQLRYISTEVFALTDGNLLVERNGTDILVTCGDERQFVNGAGKVVRREGYDPFDRQWVEA
jgi:hypothetical protein